MDETLRPRIKEVIVQSLRLPFPATEIADDVPLFGEGLGLDSIDALELVLAIERTFGVAIGDEQTAKRVAAIRQRHRRVHRRRMRQSGAALGRASLHDVGASPTSSRSMSRSGFTSAASTARSRPTTGRRCPAAWS